MSSTFGGLNTVVRGLAAQQASLDTVGHNIANASTEGYSRQAVNLATTRPQAVYGSTGDNQVGTGVNIMSITRARDGFIDKQMWKATSSLGYSQTCVDILGNVESAFNEPSDTGIQTTLDKFWKSWQTLSTNASDEGTRTAVRQRGVEMVNAIEQSAQQLTDLITDTNSLISIKVDKINQISSEMAALNRQIVTIETGGVDHANDLRDRRDLLVDQMSAIINVNVTQDKYGNYNVQTGGSTLVLGNDYQKLATTITKDVDYDYQKKNVVLEGDTQPLVFSGGELQGLIEMRDSATPTDSYDGIKGYLKKLDKISEFLLKDFNNVHKAGRGTDNSTDHNFFGSEGTDYTNFTPPANTMKWIAELKVNPALFNSANGLGLIAAKTAINNLSVQQFNSAGGAATVDSTYTGTTPINYVVRIDSVGAVVPPATVSAGDVTGVSVSLNGSATWTAVPIIAGPPKAFQITTSSGPVTIRIATDTHNKKDDTYTFSVSQGNASGDNAVKLGNCMKIDTTSTLGNSSLDSYYNSLISGLGVQAESSASIMKNQKTMVNQITNWREEVSGINVDEEMSNMIRYQKGYAAAARVLTAMDEMLDKLINSTGTVGR